MLGVKKDKFKKYLLFTITTLVAAIWLLPLIWMLSTSLKPEADTISWPIKFIPENFTLDNYKAIFSNSERTPMLRWFFNSIFIATTTTVLVVFFDALAAYAYARMEFKGRKIMFMTLMATMMIPPVTNLIPNYIIVDKLGWLDSYSAMIFPAIANVFGVFLLRQFFMGIPKELEEAAFIDGCTRFQVFRMIILPLAKPALITLSLFTFLGSWNAFLWPLIVTNSAEMKPLTPGLSLLQGYYVIEFGKLMAGALISALPVIILFLFVQRYFVQGISLTGTKG
ncbi:ABC transporter permease [Orenia metallireducens]|uniref:ABC transporter permease n=1 Tax=Orenia metallireducens TaxID=1413210 RepID=A0A1C0ADJ1_9FIRM|nr:ABC transporter permease [Orenia metallireducens]